MPFTAAELVNISAAVLDFHEKNQPKSQVKQVRPLYDDLMAGKKTFPGGKEFITGPVKGQYTTSFAGYTHDDEQAYANPANVRRYQAPWFEIGAGIQVTYTELKKDGISVTDTVTGKSTSTHSQSEKVALVNLLEDKIEDLEEGGARSFAEMLWRDGTQDSKAVPGIRSLIVNAPTTGTRLGIDAAANSWWRNKVNLAIDSSTASNQNLINAMQKDIRQLRRYGRPKHKLYAGADFIDAFEKELRSKGNYTLEGFNKSSATDPGMADVAFKGMMIQYEPLLDDLSLAKYGFMLDLNAIKLRPMEGEDMRDHTPARPPEKYVLYRARTWTGGLVADQMNTSEVFSIA